VAEYRLALKAHKELLYKQEHAASADFFSSGSMCVGAAELQEGGAADSRRQPPLGGVRRADYFGGKSLMNVKYQAVLLNARIESCISMARPDTESGAPLSVT